jgi:hypothetical protein
MYQSAVRGRLGAGPKEPPIAALAVIKPSAVMAAQPFCILISKFPGRLFLLLTFSCGERRSLLVEALD